MSGRNNLSKQISRLSFRCSIAGLDLANFKLIPDIVAINLNVFSALMKHRIAHNVQSRLIITEKMDMQAAKGEHGDL